MQSLQEGTGRSQQGGCDCGIEVQVEYVTDIMRVMGYNVMSTPAVVVDGEVKIKGSVPTEADVRKALGL